MSTISDPLLIPSKMATPIPASPQTFCLHYIHGGHQVKTKYFSFNGTKEQAIARGKRHCELLSYRFIRVDPFFSNLDADEKRNLDG